MKNIDLLTKIEFLFYTKTFREVSLDDIAKELWIKKASLYYHFASKKVLQKEVLDFSFDNFKKFIQNLPKDNLENFINDFIRFPRESKNLFSIINQNWYCSDPDFKKDIEKKQKKIFNTLKVFLKDNYWFDEEKSFLFLSLLESINNKKCIFGKCPIKTESLITQIYNIFLTKT